jgi:hypothetical protein
MLVVLTWLTTSSLAADEWLGLESKPVTLIGLDLTQQDIGYQSQMVSLGLPIGYDAGFQGQLSNSNISGGQQEFDSRTLAVLIWFQLNDLIDIEAQYLFEGDDDELEKETLAIALGLNVGNWELRIHLEQGKLLIFTRDEVADFINNIIPDRLESEVDVLGLSVGWQNRPWYWRANHQQFDYEFDLTRLNGSRFAQFVISASALAQSSLLISESSSLLVGHTDFDNDYSIAYSQDKSAINESSGETLVLSWQHWANDNVGYLLAASRPEESDDIGLTLGLRWVL